jgi:hypothetical protein
MVIDSERAVVCPSGAKVSHRGGSIGFHQCECCTHRCAGIELNVDTLLQEKGSFKACNKDLWSMVSCGISIFSNQGSPIMDRC